MSWWGCIWQIQSHFIRGSKGVPVLAPNTHTEIRRRNFLITVFRVNLGYVHFSNVRVKAIMF